MIDSIVKTDASGTSETVFTSTGQKILQGGLSFDGTTPVAGTITGATITSPTITGATLTNPTISTTTPVAVTSSTVTLGPTHVGRTVYLNRAAGIAVTLPAATGTGAKYRLVVGATFTGAASIAVASGTDYMVGTATLFADGGDTVVGFATANTGTVATESDTISMFGTGNANGGIKGATYELEDVASAVWAVRVVSDAGGTEASPFSAAV